MSRRDNVFPAYHRDRQVSPRPDASDRLVLVTASPSTVRAPDGAPRPGELFDGKYVVERVLGAGGMGYVLAATHVHLHERVAIKILLPELAGDQETVQRFLREGRAAVKIQSPHVARVKDVGELPDRTPYIVMEYLEGSDLGAVLEAQYKLPFQQAVDYVLEACEAIAEAHAMKTVHRDLKPSNLFLARMPNGTTCVKVLDFGISKMNAGEAGAVNMTSTHAVMGSPAYMSPEQLKASRTVDPRSDIWSLGVVLHELIAGTAPFSAQTVAELSVQILSEDPPWLSDAVAGVPPGLAGVVATCLRKKAAERFTDLADLADALAPFGSDEARRSAARIVSTLGVPAVRAPRIVEPPAAHVSTRTVDQFTRTAAVTPSRAAATVARSSRASGTSASALLFVGASLAVVGLAGGAYALLQRGRADARPTPSGTVMQDSPGLPVTATSAATTHGDPPPPSPGMSPAGIGVEKEPPAASVTAAKSSAARPTRPAAPTAAASVGPIAPTATPAPPAPTSTIAKSSKD